MFLVNAAFDPAGGCKVDARGDSPDVSRERVGKVGESRSVVPNTMFFRSTWAADGPFEERTAPSANETPGAISGWEDEDWTGLRCAEVLEVESG